jgi:PAS domain-containing protein
MLLSVEMTAIAQTAAAPAAPPQRLERTRFCSRCATTANDPDAQALPFGFDRVCGRCGMGVMLSAPQKVLPAPAAAFVVVTRDGRISAVSEAAERLVGEEPGLLGMPITTALTSVDDEPQLVRSLARAAGGGREIVEATVMAATQPTGKPQRMRARIASCGPPRAALLVLERGTL